MARAASSRSRGGIRIRRQRVGDPGWAFHRQAVLYREEFGYSAVFETYVAKGLYPYLANYDARRDRLWIGEMGGRPVGCVAVHYVTERPGWAQLRWFFVEKEARHRGLGSRLLKTAIAFCRRAGYRGIFLWTVNDLVDAAKVYERMGFRLVEESRRPCSWAPWGKEQRWELRLRKRWR